jgi:hypothetical protein
VNLYGFVGNAGVNWIDDLGRRRRRGEDPGGRNTVPPANRPGTPSGGGTPPRSPDVNKGSELPHDPVPSTVGGSIGAGFDTARGVYESTAFDQLRKGFSSCPDSEKSDSCECHCCVVEIRQQLTGENRYNYTLKRVYVVKRKCDDLDINGPQINPPGVRILEAKKPW